MIQQGDKIISFDVDAFTNSDCKALQTPNFDISFNDINWASSRENLSSGFATKRVSNQSLQLQRLARKLKFR